MNKDIIIESLVKMKQEVNLRGFIYQHGVDLTNYENKYYEVSLELCSQILSELSNNDKHTTKYFKNEIEWWLFDTADKVITLDDEKFNVSPADKFVDFYLTKLNN